MVMSVGSREFLAAADDPARDGVDREGDDEQDEAGRDQHVDVRAERLGEGEGDVRRRSCEGFVEVNSWKVTTPVAESTIATAIVSPRARPRPSIDAETMPLRPNGKTAIRIISQRVAPRARAASSCSTGVCRKISRQIAVMIGTTMTASTIAAVKIVRPVPRPSPREEREPAHVLVEPGVDGLHGRGEHEDAPQAEDDRGHGGQQVDDVAEALREAARCVVRDEERDAERERHGHEQREERRPDRSEQRAARRSPRSSW